VEIAGEEKLWKANSLTICCCIFNAPSRVFHSCVFSRPGINLEVMSFRASKKGSGYLYELYKLTTRGQRTFLHINGNPLHTTH